MKPTKYSVKQQARLQRASVLFGSGKLAEAAAEIRVLLRNHPADTTLLSNLGTITLHLGDIEKGASILEKSLRIDPDQPAALADYAHALSMLGQHEKALVNFDRALLLDDNHCLAHNNRGLALQFLGRAQDALESYARAVEIDPRYADAHNNMGAALQMLGRPAEAAESYDRAIALQPDYATAHNNKANVLQTLGQLAGALACCDRALALNPNFAEAYNNRGEVLMGLQRPAEALASYDSAIAAKPDYAEAYSNRSNALKDLGRWDEALASCDKAIAINPHYGDAYWNKSLLKLMAGDYAEGWRLYEWRWKSVKKGNVRNFNQPLWLGDESIEGKTIFVHREQGFGDFIQFCRYIPLLEAMGSNVILESLPAIAPLLQDFGKHVVVTGVDQLPPDSDFQCPLMSLPLAFKTTLETIPARVPYLTVGQDRRERWRGLLGDDTSGLKVGLTWSSNAHHYGEFAVARPKRSKSCPTALLSGLGAVEGVRYFSLQKDPPPDIGDLGLPLVDLMEQAGDFADTAALVSHLDLVISVDTSVAHLAGALGKSVWVLLAFDCDWRWLLGREDSPWYPTARLFRQRQLGDWPQVIADVTAALRVVARDSVSGER